MIFTQPRCLKVFDCSRSLLLLLLMCQGALPLAAQTPADPGGASDPAPDAEADAPADPSAFMSLRELDEGGPRGVRVHDSRAMPGYTLFGPINSDVIYLIDLDGEVAHSWQTDSAPGAWCYLLDDGTLLRLGREDEDPHFKGGGIGGRVQRLAPDGTILWHWNWSGSEHHQHHDIEPLPNGNLLVISWERKEGREAVRRGRDPREVDRERGFWPDMILEVKPVGTDDVEVVWEWHSWDHLVQDFEEALPEYGWIAEHPERIDINGDHRDQAPLSEAELKEQEALLAGMRALGYVGGGDDEEEGEEGGKPGDWLHTNAVDYDPVHDLIVMSTPHFSELWVIDHSTTTAEAASSSGGRFGKGGDLLWRWGNPRRHGAGKDEDQKLFYQHDPTWIEGENGELSLLVFNNGRGREDGNYSSVDELVLPFDEQLGFVREPGMPYGPEELAWQYADGDGFYSAFISGAQRLENGNTLICSGAPGRIFEVTRDGEVVWDYRNPFGGEIEPPEYAGNAPPLALFRATRIDREAPGVKALGL